jgi:hypothetical protein
MSKTRKLAAIPAADGVGYGRPADAEKDRTLARPRAPRDWKASGATTKLSRMRDGAVVRFPVIPSEKQSWRGSFERFVKGGATMFSGGKVIQRTPAKQKSLQEPDIP